MNNEEYVKSMVSRPYRGQVTQEFLDNIVFIGLPQPYPTSGVLKIIRDTDYDIDINPRSRLKYFREAGNSDKFVYVIREKSYYRLAT